MIAGIFLGYEMALQVLPGVIATQLTTTANISMSVMGWIAGVYFVSYTFMQIPGGIAFDFFSARRVLTIAALLCSLGVFLFAQQWSLLFLLAGRFLTGFASAFAFTGVLVVANQFFEKQWYPYLVGGAQFLGAFGAWAGEAPLSMTVEHLGLLQTEYLLIYIGLGLSLMSWIFIPEIEKKVDGNQIERFKSEFKATCKNRQTLFNGMYAFLCWSPIIILGGAWGVPFLEKALSISTTEAATLIGFIWLSTSISSPIVGLIANQVRSCTLPMVIIAFVGCVASISLIMYPAFLTVPMLVMVGTAASTQLLTFVLVKINNDPAVVATALGLNNMAVVAGGVVFHPLIGSLMDMQVSQVSQGQPVYAVEHFQHAFTIVPICFLLSALVAWFLIADKDPC
jgi:predicted MFS family arabinose efflux permease